MTDIETLQRAKMYLDKLANGIDPISDLKVSEDDCINQVRVSRCLFYVSDVLRRIIENGGLFEKSQKLKKKPFSITQEQLKDYPMATYPITVTEITQRINDLVDNENLTNLKAKSIISFLQQCDLITDEDSENGKQVKTPTKQGLEMGITRVERTSRYGNKYWVTVYNAEVQRIIIDNIDSIIEINNSKSESMGLQGQPWTNSQEELLRDLFLKNTSLSEMANTLQRTETGIRARLKKLGLIDNRSDIH